MNHEPLARTLRRAYDAAGATWDDGPGKVYRRLAEALVDVIPGHEDGGGPDPTGAGRTVVDAGAGTGFVSDALAARGDQPIAVDLSAGMLRAAGVLNAVVGDITALPLATGAVDGAASGFCLNHLPEPERALAELARVVVPGGFVVASVFGPQAPHPAKEVVDRVLTAHGWTVPAWYPEFKALESMVGDASSMATAAEAAGLTEIEAVERTIDIGMNAPQDLARYRLGMAHLADHVRGLADDERAAIEAEAVDALRDAPPLRPVVVLLRATAP